MSEIEALEQAHRAAQARLGLAVSLLSQAHWRSVPPANPGRGGKAWLDAMTEAVLEARELSVALSQAYYQLARAVETGTTMGAPLNSAAATLGAYRDSFIDQLLLIAEIGNGEDTPFHKLYRSGRGDSLLEAIDISSEIQQFMDSMEAVDTTEVKVEPFGWGKNPRSSEAVRKIREALFSDAVDPLTKQSSEIRKAKAQNDVVKTRTVDQEGALISEERGAEEPDRLTKLEEAHKANGNKGAGRADELALRAGRVNLEAAQNADKRVLKYARGTGPNPCAFCAMLASRGFVYASSQTASKSYRDGGLRSYHPNCHCFPIARWVDSSPLPQLNGELAELWEKEISGNYSGREAIRQWRKLLATKRQSGVLLINSPTQ